MPTYEYECTACKARSEVVQRFTDEPLTTCDVCGGTLRKVFSSVGVVFKGSGFYKTDSRGTSSSVTPAATSSNDSPSATPAASSASSASSTSTPSTTSTSE